jgi:hypothetical protein
MVLVTPAAKFCGRRLPLYTRIHFIQEALILPMRIVIIEKTNAREGSAYADQ